MVQGRTVGANSLGYMSELSPELDADPDLGYVLDLDRWASLRQAAGLTTTTLGALIGRSQFSMAEYEHGRKDPPVGIMLAVARVLGVPPSVLFRPARPEDVEVSEVRFITPRRIRRR